MVAQRIRIYLLMQWTQVRSLVQEDSTCLEQISPQAAATKRHTLNLLSLCATTTDAWAPQEKPLQWEAPSLQLEKGLAKQQRPSTTKNQVLFKKQTSGEQIGKHPRHVRWLLKKNENGGYVLNICDLNYARNLHNYSPLFPLYLPSSKN